ncbi:MAG: DNA-binding response regulator [Acidobacteria bacterium]|nr:MAG: DNA-binding response regulator [Acidobacteriota bacterium]
MSPFSHPGSDSEGNNRGDVQPTGAKSGRGRRRPPGQPPTLIRVAIADAHPVVREGLRRLLHAEQEFHVVGQAEDGTQAVKLVKARRPDVLMLDAGIPGMSGMRVLRELAKAQTECRVILLNASIDRAQVLEALRLGVRGLVTKNTTIALIIKCIRTVMTGEYWVGRESVSDLIGCLGPRRAGAPGASIAQQTELTRRELQIVAAVVAGYANKDIASRLSLSEHTVKHHLSSIFDKLGVANRLEVALLAIKQKLVDDRDPEI